LNIGTKNKNETDDKGWLFCQAKKAGEKYLANKKPIKHELDEMMICYFIPLEGKEKSKVYKIKKKNSI
jgi:hypothetical protein